MRKLFWCCAVSGVALAGGLFWAVQHGARHPESLPGQYVTGLSRSLVLLNPSTGLAPVVAEKVWHTSSTVGGEDPQEVVDIEEPIPAELDTILEPPPVETKAPPEALGNADPIVIPEDEPVKTIPQTTVDFSTFEVPAATGELVAVPNAVPMLMPYCEEDAEVLRQMPAEEGSVEALTVMPRHEDAAGSEEGSEADSGLITSESRKYDLEGDDKSDGTAKVKPARPATEDRDRGNDRYIPVCPYTGKPDHEVQSPSPAAHTPGRPSAAGSEESSEPNAFKAIKKRSLQNEGSSRPAQPGVDTMEYRPSDGNLHDFGPGVL